MLDFSRTIAKWPKADPFEAFPSANLHFHNRLQSPVALLVTDNRKFL